ncbi:Hfq-related RNA-binding protein [Candidatus Cyanaurora vandensis]|uniref:Hfq-related RNA-binding protein n=1 Tax=Candidatus Cyanaurora vandensis TaxID=2714958 RepID=UPI00257DA5B9|nr:hypothetical protein [Candidatus Cyanaurora vandensis]
MALDTTIPSTRALQRLIAEGQLVEVRLTTGDQFSGCLQWQDPECLCLMVGEQKTILWRSALAFIRPHAD